jgi:hypothetical protein
MDKKARADFVNAGLYEDGSNAEELLRAVIRLGWYAEFILETQTEMHPAHQWHVQQMLDACNATIERFAGQLRLGL